MEMVSWGGMDIHSPASYISRSDWVYADINSKNGNWTVEENKMFENGLAVYDKDSPDRWEKIVKLIPGKSLEQVKIHYSYLQQDVSSIEAGLIPIPGYTTTPYNTYNSNTTSPPFTLDWVNSRGANAVAGGGGGRFQYNPAKHHHSSSSSITTTTTTSTNGVVKRHGGRACSDHERKKGVPWTEEEHRLFLLGLKKYGKGDWRNISRNYVISRTPTQVASHAQKYFIRLSSGGKDKRRSSIHDITTVNLPDNSRPPPTTTTTTPSLPSKQCAEKTAANSNNQCKESAAATGAFFNSSAHHHHHHNHHHQFGITSTAPQPY